MTMLVNNVGPLVEAPGDVGAPPDAGPSRPLMQEPPHSVQFQAKFLNGCTGVRIEATVVGEQAAERRNSEFRRHVADLERRFDGIRRGFATSQIMKDLAAMMARRDEAAAAVRAVTDRLTDLERAHQDVLRNGGSCLNVLGLRREATLERDDAQYALSVVQGQVDELTRTARAAWRQVLSDALMRAKETAHARQTAILAELAELVADRSPEVEACRHVSLWDEQRLLTLHPLPEPVSALAPSA